MTERCHLFKLKQVLCSGKQATSRGRFANQLPNQCMQKTTAFPLRISKRTILTVSMCSYVNCTRNHGNCMQKLDANCTANLFFKKGVILQHCIQRSQTIITTCFSNLLEQTQCFHAVVLKYFPAVSVPAHCYGDTFFYKSPGEMDESQLLDRMLV